VPEIPTPRRQLPLLTRHTAGRSPMTCLYKCGDACSHPVPNESANEYFGDVVAGQVSRRGLLKAGAVGAVAAGIGLTAAPAAAAAPAAPAVPTGDAAARSRVDVSGTALSFSTIPPNQLDTVVVPNGYDSAVVIRWGDEVLPGAPEFGFDRQSAAAQLRQFGYNNDFVAMLPLGADRALLYVNHEYTNEELMFPGFTGLENLTLEQIRIAMAAHGGSVVEIERVARTGEWAPVTRGRRRFNRRITAMTPMRLTGPAAGGALLRTAADPTGRRVLGTLNNCAGGTTPWGTVLSGEENFNQYFVGADAAPAEYKPAYARYGIDVAKRYPTGSRRWERADGRFDLGKNPNEANRFGWIVEIDPYDPESTPRKHTALGRFKHEGATIAVAKDGRVAAYMGDDERFDYIYKFVSSRKMRPGSSRTAREWNLRLLEEGTLYVAKLTGDSPAAEIDGSGAVPSDGAFDGSGQWIPLTDGRRSFVPGFTVEQVLVNTRLAADAVGPTKMDRPEDIQPNPKTGKIYCALTNNTSRVVATPVPPSGRVAGVDEANPRPANKNGHILEITEARNDAAATTFTWALPIVCGDPGDPSTYFAGYDKTKVSPISCPDNVAFDKAGNLWISTDGNALAPAGENVERNFNDGLFAVPLEGPERGHLKQFATVPRGAETCGPLISDDQRTAFIAVQHPGEETGASVEAPASTWPDGTAARPAVVAIWRIADGSKRIGS
jgi:secreted PhoX family phosphatase